MSLEDLKHLASTSKKLDTRFKLHMYWKGFEGLTTPRMAATRYDGRYERGRMEPGPSFLYKPTRTRAKPKRLSCLPSFHDSNQGEKANDVCLSFVCLSVYKVCGSNCCFDRIEKEIKKVVFWPYFLDGGLVKKRF